MRLLLSCVVLLLGSFPCQLVAQQVEVDRPASLHEYPIDDYDRQHWSFQPIVSPELPEVKSLDWIRSPIDYFILSELERSGISPLPQASRPALLRRLKFDLHGLPPSPEEVQEFVEDSSPDAYERLVDDLLASHHHGERWAQYWLDLARFAETDGFEWDKVREAAWRYRQWVVDALNDDMPYDEFVAAQLLGDTHSDRADEVATMFLLAGPDMPDINEQDLRRHDKLNELTGTVGAVLLGLQMQCAQCHDHKFDPISQADFYRLRAIFAGSIPPMKRDRPQLFFTDHDTNLTNRFYSRGDLHQPGPIVSPLPPRIVFEHDVASFDSVKPRAAFVRWLFAEENPLTARVMANRIWQFHFGHSLCENPSDFGVIAASPTHPQLLDYLATQLRAGDWSLKKLHRQIVLSATYRQLGHVSTEDSVLFQHYAKNVEADPENEYYSRFPRRRLEGELVRDALLTMAGTLDRRYGGQSVRPPLPQELLQTLLKGQWETSPNPADHHRRSIYTFARRNLRYPIFDVFDRPDAGASCARRNESITAPQSLQMLNSELSLRCSHQLAQRLLDESASLSSDALSRYEHIIQRLYLIVYARPVEQDEMERLLTFFDTQSPAPLFDRLWTITTAVVNTNEFLTID